MTIDPPASADPLAEGDGGPPSPRRAAPATHAEPTPDVAAARAEDEPAS